jgi:AcrR family transcriptional regulator
VPTPAVPTHAVPCTDRHRALALPAAERRAAIVAAALPLMVERGTNVTTRQIADAAGVAEGTLFRVFPDKDALLRAVIDTALDSSRTAQVIAAIDGSLPLERRLEEAVRIVQRRTVEMWRLVSAAADSDALKGRTPTRPGDLEALTELFEPERHRIRYEPVQAALALRALAVASSHPALHGGDPTEASEIVSIVLDGVRTRRSRPRAGREGAPC